MDNGWSAFAPILYEYIHQGLYTFYSLLLSPMQEFHAMEKQHRMHTYLPTDYKPIVADTLDPAIWGPHYWFVLHTVAQTYPEVPTSVTKRKYYDFIQNLPLFIPNHDIGDRLIELLDKFPVSPYLDSRDSFVRWVHFLHNKINVVLGKEELTLFDALDKYREHYRPPIVRLSQRYHIQKEYVYLAITIVFVILIAFLYR